VPIPARILAAVSAMAKDLIVGSACSLTELLTVATGKLVAVEAEVEVDTVHCEMSNETRDCKLTTCATLTDVGAVWASAPDLFAAPKL
jgi:hypothetical protein